MGLPSPSCVIVLWFVRGSARHFSTLGPAACCHQIRICGPEDNNEWLWLRQDLRPSQIARFFVLQHPARAFPSHCHVRWYCCCRLGFCLRRLPIITGFNSSIDALPKTASRSTAVGHEDLAQSQLDATEVWSQTALIGSRRESSWPELARSGRKANVILLHETASALLTCLRMHVLPCFGRVHGIRDPQPSLRSTSLSQPSSSLN